MTAKFKGKIELDIRDSEPDWAPYLPAEGARGRAERPAARVGRPRLRDDGHLRRAGGVPDDAPHRGGRASRSATSTPPRCARRRVRRCSPAATRRPTAWRRSPSSPPGFPGISTRIPFENGFLSEVLAEHGYNTYCVGKWHLTPGEECNLAAFKGRWPLGRGFERFYGYLGGETNSWYPDLVHDNHQIEPPATPEEGYHFADDMADRADRVHPRREGRSTPTSRSSCTSRRVAGHAPHHVPAGVGRQVQGHVRPGLRGDPRRDPRPAEGARAAARGHRAVADQPARRARAHRSRRPALAAARHRAPVGLAERRRAAAVHPHGRGVRRLHLLQRRPHRPGPRLPRGVGPARQHDDHRDLRQRRERRGRPERLVQRVAVLQRRPGHDRDARCRTSTSSARRSRTTTTAPAGRGRSTRRSRTGSAGRATRAASPT